MLLPLLLLVSLSFSRSLTEKNVQVTNFQLMVSPRGAGGRSAHSDGPTINAWSILYDRRRIHHNAVSHKPLRIAITDSRLVPNPNTVVRQPRDMQGTRLFIIVCHHRHPTDHCKESVGAACETQRNAVHRSVSHIAELYNSSLFVYNTSSVIRDVDQVTGRLIERMVVLEAEVAYKRNEKSIEEMECCNEG